MSKQEEMSHENSSTDRIRCLKDVKNTFRKRINIINLTANRITHFVDESYFSF